MKDLYKELSDKDLQNIEGGGKGWNDFNNWLNNVSNGVEDVLSNIYPLK